jgi:Rod binding domain-containing protein
MSVNNSIPMRNAINSYMAAAQAKAGSKEAKAFKTAQSFEGMLYQNMLEGMTAGLGQDGPLGSGQAGGGAWRGFLLDEMAKGASKSPSGGLGIAPHVYREMMRIQEKGA